jgi:hypothetical protein
VDAVGSFKGEAVGGAVCEFEQEDRLVPTLVKLGAE